MSNKDNQDQTPNNPEPPMPPVQPLPSAHPQPYPPQPAYPGQPSAPYAPPIENPGQTTGIVGLVLNFLGINIGGIILGAISRSKSKAANQSTVLGTISLIWGIVGTVFGFLAIVFFIVLVALAAVRGNMENNSSSFERSLENSLLN